MMKITKMEAELDRLMEGLGAEVDEESKRKKTVGPSKLALLYFKFSIT